MQAPVIQINYKKKNFACQGENPSLFSQTRFSATIPNHISPLTPKNMKVSRVKNPAIFLSSKFKNNFVVQLEGSNPATLYHTKLNQFQIQRREDSNPDTSLSSKIKNKFQVKWGRVQNQIPLCQSWGLTSCPTVRVIFG